MVQGGQRKRRKGEKCNFHGHCGSASPAHGASPCRGARVPWVNAEARAMLWWTANRMGCQETLVSALQLIHRGILGKSPAFSHPQFPHL